MCQAGCAKRGPRHSRNKLHAHGIALRKGMRSMSVTTRNRIAEFFTVALLIGMVCGLPAIAAEPEPGTGMQLAEASPAVPAPASEEGPKAHIVSLGLWGLQNLFRT